jgi:hypothetical protein
MMSPYGLVDVFGSVVAAVWLLTRLSLNSISRSPAQHLFMNTSWRIMLQLQGNQQYRPD